MPSVLVVDRDLLARKNVAEREDQNVARDSAHESVRCAGVVDIVRAITAPAAIKAPFAVDVTNTQLRAMRAAFGLAIRNSLSRVLGNFSAATKWKRREAAFAVNR